MTDKPLKHDKPNCRLMRARNARVTGVMLQCLECGDAAQERMKFPEEEGKTFCGFLWFDKAHNRYVVDIGPPVQPAAPQPPAQEPNRCVHGVWAADHCYQRALAPDAQARIERLEADLACDEKIYRDLQDEFHAVIQRAEKAESECADLRRKLYSAMVAFGDHTCGDFQAALNDWASLQSENAELRKLLTDAAPMLRDCPEPDCEICTGLCQRIDAALAARGK